jgi:hypothetical protein
MPTHALRRSSCLTLALATLFALGCKSYQLGGPELPFESIYVQPATNDSFAPQAQALLSGQIRDAFIRDGRLKLTTSEESADALLLVNVTEYDRRAASRARSDTVRARDFDLFLSAQISLYDQNRGDYMFEARTISERSNAYVDNPYLNESAADLQTFQQAEYQAMPRLTRDLARKIADEVLSPWPAK